MASSSHRKATSSSLQRFNDYLDGLREEFEHRSNASMNGSSLRRFNIYLGNLKGEFELMSLEIESLRKERDEFEAKAEVQAKVARRAVVCERCSNLGTARVHGALGSFFFKPLLALLKFTKTAISSSSRLDSHSSLPASTASADPDSCIKQRNQSVRFNNEVTKELDVEIAHTWSHGKMIGRVTFSQDGKYLASACYDSEGKVYIHDVQTGTLTCVLRNLLAEKSHLRTVCFSRDRKYLATGSGDGPIYIWEINTKYVRNALKGHSHQVNSLDFSPNGQLLVSTSNDNTVRLWNMRDGATRILTEDNPTYLEVPCYSSAVFSPDGKYVAASHRDGIVRVWGVHSGQLIKKVKAHVDWATDVAFTPDGKGLLSASWDKVVRYWDSSLYTSARLQTVHDSHGEPTGVLEPERNFLGHKAAVNSLDISPDGRWVASGSDDHSVRIWDSRNALMQCSLKHDDLVWTVDFSPAGGYLASGGEDGKVRIWKYSNISHGNS